MIRSDSSRLQLYTIQCLLCNLRYPNLLMLGTKFKGSILEFYLMECSGHVQLEELVFMELVL